MINNQYQFWKASHAFLVTSSSIYVSADHLFWTNLTTVAPKGFRGIYFSLTPVLEIHLSGVFTHHSSRRLLSHFHCLHCLDYCQQAICFEESVFERFFL